MRLLKRALLDRGGDLGRYLDQVSALCPFLVPALQADALTVYQWDVAASVRALPCVAADEWLFALAVILSERSLRRDDSQTAGILYSENILCIGLPLDGPHPFIYPHWALKCMYRQRGLVYGKFLNGRAAAHGRAVLNVADLFTVRKLSRPSKEHRFYDVSRRLLRHFRNRAFLPDYEQLEQDVKTAIACADVVHHDMNDTQILKCVAALHECEAYRRSLDVARKLYDE